MNIITPQIDGFVQKRLTDAQKCPGESNNRRKVSGRKKGKNGDEHLPRELVHLEFKKKSVDTGRVMDYSMGGA
jgi:hypothetical protein